MKILKGVNKYGEFNISSTAHWCVVFRIFRYSGNSVFVDILDDVVKGYGGLE